MAYARVNQVSSGRSFHSIRVGPSIPKMLPYVQTLVSVVFIAALHSGFLYFLISRSASMHVNIVVRQAFRRAAPVWKLLLLSSNLHLLHHMNHRSEDRRISHGVSLSMMVLPLVSQVDESLFGGLPGWDSLPVRCCGQVRS